MSENEDTPLSIVVVAFIVGNVLLMFRQVVSLFNTSIPADREANIFPVDTETEFSVRMDIPPATPYRPARGCPG